MKILKLHADNFGKLSNLDLTLSGGLNAWQEENGFGKTTLATFVAVMFYGFLDEKGKKLPGDCMRERLRPWQGGKYGGNLVFSNEEGTFTIIREFADSPVRDRLDVLDQDGRKTERFGRIPGQEIFGIDGESFLRTIFIRDNDLRASVPDDVSARLGSLLDDTMDMNRYEDAQERMKRLSDSLSPKRSTGSVYRDKARAAELRQKLRGEKQAEENLERLNERVRAQENEAAEAAEEKHAVDEKIGKLVAHNALMADRHAYESLLAEKMKRNNEYIRTRSQFPREVPSDQELLDAQSAQRNAEKLEQTLRDSRLTDEEQDTLRKAERIFFESTVLPGETAEMYDVLERMKTAEKETAVLKSELSARRDAIAEMRQKEAERRAAEARLQEKQAEAAAAKMLKMMKLIRILAIVLGAIGLLVLGVYLFLSLRISDFEPHSDLLLYGGVPLLIGIALFIMAQGLASKLKTAGAGETGQTAAVPTEEEPDDEKLKELQSRIEESEERAAQEEQKLRAYIGRFGVPFNESRLAESISALETLKNEQDRIVEKRNKGEAAEELYNTAENAVRRFIVSLGMTPAEDLHTQLERIEDQLDAFRNADREFGNAKEAMERFEQAHDMESIRRITPPDFPETLEELQQMSREIQSRIQKTKETALQFSRDAEQAERVLDEMRDDEEALSELDAKINADTRRYDLLLKAQEGLKTAKLSLSRKYASPVTEHFRKYLGQILSKGQEEYRLDPDGQVLVEDHNEPRSVGTLSHGFRDLSYFCMRIALVDSMYQEERPPLLLDDPFVNLDDEHAARALDIVKTISENYQVLYFTCSEGRMVGE